jgi:cobalamin biosynthesis protein CobT
MISTQFVSKYTQKVFRQKKMFQIKMDETKLIKLLSFKTINKKGLVGAGVTDAFLFSNLSKGNLVRYIIWVMMTHSTPFEQCLWIKSHLKLAQFAKWTNGPYLSAKDFYKKLSDHESESEYEESDSQSDAEDETDAETDYKTELEDDSEAFESDSDDSEPTEKHQKSKKAVEKLESALKSMPPDTKKKKTEPEESFPGLSRSQTKMILGSKIELTSNAQNFLEMFTVDIVKGTSAKKIQSLSEKMPENKIFKGLVKNTNPKISYKLFLLQSLRFLILKSAFDICVEKGLSQIKTSLLEKLVSGDNEIGFLFSKLQN